MSVPFVPSPILALTSFDEGLTISHDIVTRVIEWCRVSGVDFLIDTVAAFVVLAIGWAVAHFGRRLVHKVLSRGRLGDQLRAHLLVSFSTGVWWVFVLFIVCRCYDVNFWPAVTGISVAGIIVGFAFQETLSSLAAGIMLCFSEPFEVGDEVSIAGYDGFLLGFGYTSSRVRTYDNRVVTIPNKQVWGAPLVNYTRLATRRCDRTVGIAYSADVDKALAVAKEALLSMPQILKDPEPQVMVASLDDSAVTLKIWPWCKTEDYWTVWKTSYAVIKAAFDRNGIAIPFPQMDVHMDPNPKNELT